MLCGLVGGKAIVISGGSTPNSMGMFPHLRNLGSHRISDLTCTQCATSSDLVTRKPFTFGYLTHRHDR